MCTPSQCTDEFILPHVGLTGDTKISLSSLEPKSLRMVILTIILVQVLCVINRQNIILKYGMRDHFRYTYLPLSFRDRMNKMNKMEIVVLRHDYEGRGLEPYSWGEWH